MQPNEPSKGLPPVTPPSGRHIAQLFVIPGVIVAGAVTILLGFSWLAGGSRAPDALLNNIDSPNSDIRWRAASDLAQVLKRDDMLASDVGFGLRLAERLARAVEELDRVEQARIDAPADGPARARAHETYLAQRNYVQYLAACLGSLSTPVGAPMLCDLAKNGRGKDPKLRVLIRRHALWALANLGDNQKRFHRLSDERKAEIRRMLETEASAGGSQTKQWADLALGWLDGKSVGVIDVLVECAREPVDVFLREQAAHAFIFWDGDEREKKLVEQTLIALARDSGRGERIEINDGE